MIEGLLLLLSSDAAVPALLAGTAAGLAFGVLPGVSGRTGLIVLAPLMIGVDPLTGAVFLLALHAVVHTSGSIPAILVGVPTSSAEAATVLDGYALTRRGRAGLAIGVSLAASAFGGCLGAAALIVMMYVFTPVIAQIGQPEILMLSLLGLAMVAALATGRVAEGIASAALGVLAGCIGLDSATGTPRYVASALELWDGLDIPALVTGLFVMPELMAHRHPTAPGSAAGAMPRWRATVLGMAAVLRHFGLLVRSSLIGVVVGIVPGMGASIAVWLAYGHAVQTTRSRIAFGRGALAGVLAPEAANNSKEGGALAPTLFLGIPGSSSMAIMLAAFAGMGLRPGPHWLTTDAALTGALAWTIALANLIAVPACLVAAPLMARFATRTQQIMPAIAVCAATASAYCAAPFASTLLQLAVFTTIGCAMRAANWPRPAFVLGFVVGPLIEGALQKTIALYGQEMFARPGVLLGGVVILASLAYGFRRSATAAERGDPRWSFHSALAVMAVGALAVWQAHRFPALASLLPRASGTALVLAAGVAIARTRPTRRRHEIRGAGAHTHPASLVIVATAAFMATAWMVGLPLAAGFFLLGWLALREHRPWSSAIALGAVAAAIIALGYKLADAPDLLLLGRIGQTG